MHLEWVVVLPSVIWLLYSVLGSPKNLHISNPGWVIKFLLIILWRLREKSSHLQFQDSDRTSHLSSSPEFSRHVSFACLQWDPLLLTFPLSGIQAELLLILSPAWTFTFIPCQASTTPSIYKTYHFIWIPWVYMLWILNFCPRLTLLFLRQKSTNHCLERKMQITYHDQRE